MVAINFQARFAELVATGKKKQTIRLSPRGIKPGTELQLYTGQRTKSCRKLGDAVCTRIDEIKLEKDKALLGIYVAFVSINNSDLFTTLALRDGFSSYSEMYEWFSQRYKRDVINGWLIQWENTISTKKGD